MTLKFTTIQISNELTFSFKVIVLSYRYPALLTYLFLKCDLIAWLFSEHSNITSTYDNIL